MRAADLHKLARTLREVALIATQNIGDDQVSAGELAVVEDLAAHPGTTVGEVAARCRLAQSLVSRIVRVLDEADLIVSSRDDGDRRKTRLQLDPAARQRFALRADVSISSALVSATPALTRQERAVLEEHLASAAELLRRGR